MARLVAALLLHGALGHEPQCGADSQGSAVCKRPAADSADVASMLQLPRAKVSQRDLVLGTVPAAKKNWLAATILAAQDLQLESASDMATEQETQAEPECTWVQEEQVPQGATSLDCWRPAAACVARFTLSGKTYYGCTYAGAGSTPRCSRHAVNQGAWLQCEPIPCAPTTPPEAIAAAASSGIAFPLQTSGRFIVDSSGYRVKWQCVNWYGMHMKQLVPNGLDQRSAEQIAAFIKSSGFNCVRLPYAVAGYMHNPELKPEYLTQSSGGSTGRTHLSIFDEVVAALTSEGLMVILNNHMSDLGWCCSFSDGNGLWFNKNYTEENFLMSVWGLSQRYRNNPLVVAHDTRNEVRPSSSGTALWAAGRTDTRPGLLYSLKAATEKAAAAVLQAAHGQHLVVVEPIAGYLMCQFDMLAPLRVPCLANRLVWSVHDYDSHASYHKPAVEYCRGNLLNAIATLFSGQVDTDVNYSEFKSSRYITSSHIALAPFRQAPLWFGEFGTDTENQWWNNFVAYMDEFDFDYAYWSLDGYAYPSAAQALGDAAPEHGQDETYGLVNQDFQTVRHPWKLQALQALLGERLGKLRPGVTARTANSTGKIPAA